jgi:hypothetical protein
MYASSQTKDKISWVMCNKEGWTRKLQKADFAPYCMYSIYRKKVYSEKKPGKFVRNFEAI